MTRATRLVSLAAVCGALAAGAPLRAQNLIVNPDFDTDLVGWTDPALPWLAASWNAEDWIGDAESGSARVVNTSDATSTAAGLAQCVELVADGATAYEFRAQARAGEGGGLAGIAEIGLSFHGDAACDGFYYGDTERYWSAESWAALGEFGFFDFFPPNGTHSIRFEIRTFKSAANGSYEALFDHAYLPEGGALASTGAALLALAMLDGRLRHRV